MGHFGNDLSNDHLMQKWGFNRQSEAQFHQYKSTTEEWQLNIFGNSIINNFYIYANKSTKMEQIHLNSSTNTMLNDS